MPPATADETKERIVKEAERLFRHYGYAKTTVADIAAACAMSPANVYRFFASKAEINEAICSTVIVNLEAVLREIVARDAPASERLSAFIALLAKHTVETLVHEKKVHDMVVVAMEEQWGAIERHIQFCTALISEIIASGIAVGEFKPGNAEQAGRCVSTAIAAIKHPVIVAQCRDDPNTASADELIAFILSALRA